MVSNKAQVQGEVVLTSRQVEVINGCQLQDVEEAGEERHGSTDGGTCRKDRRSAEKWPPAERWRSENGKCMEKS